MIIYFLHTQTHPPTSWRVLLGKSSCQPGNMINKTWVYFCIIFAECHLVAARDILVQEKAESTIPVTTLSPPEGNTTFIDGTTWCVALPGVSQIDLQNALDWACGVGMADCSPIQEGGACYKPDTLLSHASYAFNNYYQQNGNSDVACNFGGTATLTKHNPSYVQCDYAASGSIRSHAPPLLKKHNANLKRWNLLILLIVILWQ